VIQLKTGTMVVGYMVEVITGDVKGAGSSAQVYIILDPPSINFQYKP